MCICIPPRIWSPFGINIGHSGEEFWEALRGKNQLLRVLGSCGFTLSPKGVLATFAFLVFSVSSPRGRSRVCLRMPPRPNKIPSRRIIEGFPRATLPPSAANSLFSPPLRAEGEIPTREPKASFPLRERRRRASFPLGENAEGGRTPPFSPRFHAVPSRASWKTPSEKPPLPKETLQKPTLLKETLLCSMLRPWGCLQGTLVETTPPKGDPA